MVDALTPGAEESGVSAVSWTAILAAGGVASAALTLLMLAFGTGMGFSVVSPWSSFRGLLDDVQSVGRPLSHCGSNDRFQHWGYLAGRLRTKWSGVHTHEVYFAIRRTVFSPGPSPR
jgi:hypothetical protein